MRRSYRGVLTAAVLLALASLAVLPALAGAAAVEVHEPQVEGRSEFLFRGSGNETNEVTITYTAGDATHFGVHLVDAGATVVAGAGCSGGGAPGSPVDCLVHRYHQMESTPCGRVCSQPIPGTNWVPELKIFLGDGGSSFAAPEGDPPGEGPVPMEVTGGSGPDTIATGGGHDVVDPGLGHDTVHTRGGNDYVFGGAVPDGPDLYDLGPGLDAASYERRTTPVFFRESAPSESGALGENDTILSATGIIGGSGDDTLFGGAEVTELRGEAGADLLVGGAGADTLIGGIGSDRYFGGDGNDEMLESRSGRVPIPAADGNFADGGGGNDYISLDAGPDEALGGSGDDTIRGGGGNDLLRGGSGADLLLGNEGDDGLEGEEGNDGLVGGLGGDRLLAGAGNDRVLAGNELDPLAEAPEIRNVHPLAEVDSWRDEVDCEAGNDSVGRNPWDLTRGCEHRFLVQIVEIGAKKSNPATGTAWIQVGVESAGALRMHGPAINTVNKRRGFADAIFPKTKEPLKSGMRLRVKPHGAALAKLRRYGRTRVALKLTFTPKQGFARTRVTHVTLVARRR
jgi:hypothetical protein